MPIITIKAAAATELPGLEPTIAAAAAELSTRILRKRHELTAVIVEAVDPAGWFVGGRSLRDHGQASFWLEIKVVDGTNSKEEKEAFVAAVFERFGALLGDLHPESYVHVEEVSADAYGFGGLTQERRFIADRLKVPPMPTRPSA